MQTSQLITKREASRVLGLTVSSVTRLTEAGELTIADTIPGPQRAALHLYSRAAVERLARKRSKVSA